MADNGCVTDEELAARVAGDHLDPKFTTAPENGAADLRRPFHLALVWLRLERAVDAVHNATGTLDGPLVAGLNALSLEAWHVLYDTTNPDTERQQALDQAREYLKASPR